MHSYTNPQWIKHTDSEPVNQILGLIGHIIGNSRPGDFPVKNVVKDYLCSQDGGSVKDDKVSDPNKFVKYNMNSA